jgi:hypothetical protein
LHQQCFHLTYVTRIVDDAKLFSSNSFPWAAFGGKIGPRDIPEPFTQWSGWGGNYHNNAWASQNRQISSSNIKSAIASCNVSYHIGVSATPVVFGNNVYYPTWNGSFAALDYVSCRILWQVNVTDIIENYASFITIPFGPHPVSRTSP